MPAKESFEAQMAVLNVEVVKSKTTEEEVIFALKTRQGDVKNDNRK